MKKSLQFISGKKLAGIIALKVTRKQDFADYVGWTRQYINDIKGKEKVKVSDEKIEKLKSYLNITIDEIKYDPMETEWKPNGNTPYPVSSSILEELETCRKDLAHWRGLAQEYETELDKLRGQQK